MDRNKSFEKIMVESYYGVPDKNKFGKLLKNLSVLFQYSYDFDKKKVAMLIEESADDVKDIVKKLIRNTEYISFEKFIGRMNSCIYRLISSGVKKDRPVFIYLDSDLKTQKSRYWLYLYVTLFILYITNKKKEIIYIENYRHPQLRDDDTIVLIDDCIYSDYDVSKYPIYTNLFNLQKPYTFYLLIPYASKIALKIIDDYNFKLSETKRINTFEVPNIFLPKYYLHTIKSVNDVLNAKEIKLISDYYKFVANGDFNNKQLIYFNHKMEGNHLIISELYLGIVPCKYNLEVVKQLNKKYGIINALNYKKFIEYFKIIPIIKNYSDDIRDIDVMNPISPIHQSDRIPYTQFVELLESNLEIVY